MNRACDKFFARARFTSHQHGQRARCKLADHGDHLPHCRAFTDDSFETKRALSNALERFVLTAQHHRLSGAMHEIAQHHEINGLLNEVVRAALQRLLRSGNITVRSDHDCLRVRLLRARERKHFKTRDLGLHHEICDDHIEMSMQEFITRSSK